MHDSRGREIPDPIPVEIPVQWRRPPTIQEQIKMFVRRELSQQSAEEGAETFEEADDFDVGDDYDPTSPYEELYDPNPVFADASAGGDPDKRVPGKSGDDDGRNIGSGKDPSTQAQGTNGVSGSSVETKSA